MVSKKRDESKTKELKPKTPPKMDPHEKKLKAAFKAVANMKNGEIVFREIMLRSGFKDDLTVGNPQTRELNRDSIIHNNAIRGFYVRLREFIPGSLLNKIEAERDEKEDTESDEN